MRFIVYALVSLFVWKLMFAGGMYSLAGAFIFIYLAKAAYADFRYKPEDDEQDAVEVKDVESLPEDASDPEPGAAEVADELAEATQTHSPRGTVAVSNPSAALNANADLIFDNSPD